MLNIKSLHVKYSLLFSHLNETLNFSTDIRKNSIVNFDQNLSSESRVVPCSRTDGQTDRQRDGRT